MKVQIGYGINLEEMLWLTASPIPRSGSNENPVKIILGTSRDRFGGGKMLQLTESYAA